ncbi:hypothetical protein JCM16816_10870 [Thermoanaerobacter brockii subsp. lactiethylicus]|jgi:transcriptional regulator with XRE-family HTH domain|uniref:Transcriptional regulator, XRE family n=1 Tax=Thermoanaerobacter pseudethanolicus (strain ATCC 33223 / 39E) TaxID=340099 RepID=B0K8Y5_THEP3|nr:MULTISPECIES: helix-turn-helix transcriptional regulator [Thermoanaerobacter]KUJ89919.1 MAG: helix-turn-helix domain-containing protein [Thermoanaerobacter thermocopriae]ABY92652.1 putative transcriptional regulator, XRE family [Thermoanaerobacter sp. X514]ABY94598.1 transcriptional regulator, XRE family [Thermoanaerobacter pseudethanolicus ATCC 33223]HAA64707.1 XRE family transcriptional regulator [Thermoanaerobacter sp.]HAA80773.1 XRE family transcriptional regulator [Thermoanaerobacter s
MDGFYSDLEAFGEELKNIRKSLGLSQSDVTEQVFISRDTLRKFENGKVIPKQETLDLLSHLYECKSIASSSHSQTRGTVPFI